MMYSRRGFLGLGLVLLSATAGRAAPSTPSRNVSNLTPSMKVYPSRYYIIHSDLDRDDVKEAIIRMNKMAEEYHQRTLGFSGEVRDRLPFYLFRNKDDYYASGGLPGSAGVFRGKDLLALAGEHPDPYTWHVVQHEGFHQFAAAVIRGHLPPWLNEGIAEYFGESLFTGDGFISGIIPPSRLKRIQAQIRDNKFRSIAQMMQLSQDAWNSKLTGANYDQAWSMVHFLAHGENGKYQQPFVGFMQALGRGIPLNTAWRKTFGDVNGFEDHWRDYWLGLDPDPTADLYAQATTATLTSFYARAVEQRQHFSSFDEFLQQAQDGKIKTGESEDDWLPPDLLAHAVESVNKLKATGTLHPEGLHGPQLTLTLSSGMNLVGTAQVRYGHISKVSVDMDDTAESVAKARQLIDEGKKPQARTVLMDALKAHPNSPAAKDARDLIKQTR